MHDIQRKYIERLDVALRGMGASYVIILDGEKFGNLDVPIPKPKSKRPKKRSFAQFKVREKISAMKVGDVVTFTAADGFTAEDIRGNASSCAVVTFGKKSVVTSIKGDTVDILRVF